MNNHQNPPVSVKHLPSLGLALEILLNRQEKNWGCFQVIKEEEFYSLFIPTLDSFKLYKNPKSENFKGYWRDTYQVALPDVKNRAEKPDVFLRIRSKQIDNKQKNTTLSIRKKQRIIDVKYRFNSCPEMYRINQMIAQLIRDRIANNISFDPRTEIQPLVLATEVQE